MNLLADEGVDRPIVARLRQEGHQVLYIAEMDPGISDDEVLERANRQNALLLTADKDFGELVFRLGRITAGVVLLRLGGLSRDLKSDLVASAFREYGEKLYGTFAVISGGSIRIRRGEQPSAI